MKNDTSVIKASDTFYWDESQPDRLYEIAEEYYRKAQECRHGYSYQKAMLFYQKAEKCYQLIRDVYQAKLQADQARRQADIAKAQAGEDFSPDKAQELPLRSASSYPSTPPAEIVYLPSVKEPARRESPPEALSTPVPKNYRLTPAEKPRLELIPTQPAADNAAPQAPETPEDKGQGKPPGEHPLAWRGKKPARNPKRRT